MRGSDILTLCLLIIQLNPTNSTDTRNDTEDITLEKDKLGDEEEEDFLEMESNGNNNIRNVREIQDSVEEEGVPSTTGDIEEVTKGEQVETTEKPSVDSSVSVNNGSDRDGRQDSNEANQPDEIAENITERSIKEPTEELSSRAGNNQTTGNVTETDGTVLDTTLYNFLDQLFSFFFIKGETAKSNETTTSIEDELNETNPAEVINSTSNELITESPEENTMKETTEVETATEPNVSSQTTTENTNTNTSTSTSTTMKVGNPDDIPTSTDSNDDKVTSTNPTEVITSTSNESITESPEGNTTKETEIETTNEESSPVDIATSSTEKVQK